MTLRAVILDVYGTLLEVGPPRSAPERERLWQGLHQRFLGRAPHQGYTEFSAACEDAVRREHAAARTLGIESPEVDWPGMVTGLIPGLGGLCAATRRGFLGEVAGLPRSLRLADGVAPELSRLRERGILLGIASNAQPYTLDELAAALAPAGLDLSAFESGLCFWSFENGFSKPNPHVFRILGARLRTRGIEPAGILMVGDRLDNDVEPARRFGWRAWHLHPAGDGCWPELANRLESDFIGGWR